MRVYAMVLLATLTSTAFAAEPSSSINPELYYAFNKGDTAMSAESLSAQEMKNTNGGSHFYTLQVSGSTYLIPLPAPHPK